MCLVTGVLSDIVNHLDHNTSFESKITINLDDNIFHLSSDISSSSDVSQELPDQPPSESYPPGCCYAFPSRFVGDEHFNSLFDFLSSSCTDCILHTQRRKFKNNRDSNLHYDVRCSKYKAVETDDNDFLPGHFTKTNTIRRTNKTKRTQNQLKVTDRMHNKKMKGKGASTSAQRRPNRSDKEKKHDRTSVNHSTSKSR